MDRRAPMSHDLASLIADSILASLDHAEKYPPPSGGPQGAFSRDLGAIASAPADARKALENLQATMLSAVEMFLAHAVDHTRSLASDMLRNPMPIWSSLTLCRGVQESTVWMRHLLDPPISTETRLCRIAALWLDDSQPARATALTFGTEHGAGVAEYYRFKLTELEAGGFTIDVGRDQRPCAFGSAMPSHRSN